CSSTIRAFALSPVLPYTPLFRSEHHRASLHTRAPPSPVRPIVRVRRWRRHASQCPVSKTERTVEIPVRFPQRFVECRRRCWYARSEEHTSELQSRENLVCRLLLE